MRPYKIFVSSLSLLSIVASAATAQVNVEKYLRVGDRRGAAGHVQFDLSHKRGNVDLTEVGIELNASYSWPGMTAFTVLRSDYGWQGGERFSDDALAHIRQVFQTGRRVQPELFAQIDYSRPRLLDHRSLAGGGFRIVLGGGAHRKILCGTSVMGESERYDLDPGDSHPRSVDIIRWSNYLSANLDLGARAGCALIAYAQPKINDFGDLRLLCEASVRAEIISRLSLAVSLKARYDSRPPDSIETLDTELKSGLAWVF